MAELETNQLIERLANAVIAKIDERERINLIAQVVIGKSPGIMYYAFDHLGSTQFLTGAAGTVTDRYSYYAWGGNATHVGATAQPYQYVG